MPSEHAVVNLREPSPYTSEDYAEFRERLRAETGELAAMFAEGRFDHQPPSIGYELESCLVDQEFRPAQSNAAFLKALDILGVQTELARCNVEFNGRPHQLACDGLRRMHLEMDQQFQRGRTVAESLGLRLLSIGILPTLRRSDLALEQMSEPARYTALDEAVARMRGHKRVELRIEGRDHYQGYYDSIMAESAATSLQIHLSLPPARAHRWYNAAVVAAAPVLAIATNSPYLLDHDLWSETRVPVFAQAIDIDPIHYVTFGNGYLKETLLELFEENRTRYPVLLPQRCAPTGLAHLLLHNGTIWRWNRPIVDAIGAAGHAPHLWLEQRALAGGPSVLDMIADCAFFYGVIKALGEAEPPPETRMSFQQARTNFYRAARYGMQAPIQWVDDRTHCAFELVRDGLLPLAHQGLTALDVDAGDRQRYLDVIAARVHRGWSGADWQRGFVARHGPDMRAMLAAYADHQGSGAPVSEWPL